jgi:hypothetical protein
MTTTTAIRPGVYDHAVTGTAGQLAALLRHHTSAGTLVAATAPRRLPDGRCSIILRLRTNPAARRRVTRPATPVRTRRTGRIAALVLAIAGAAAGLLTAIAWLLGQLVAFLTAHAAALAGVAIALVAIIAALGRAGVCPGIHCPGCTHH